LAVQDALGARLAVMHDSARCTALTLITVHSRIFDKLFRRLHENYRFPNF